MSSPDGTKVVVPMLNDCYAKKSLGKFVTFDVRDRENKFMHHVQSCVTAYENWTICWQGNDKVVVKGSKSGEWAYVVGLDSLYYPQQYPPYPGYEGR
jgi:hypothetical protein